jgi:hypothetical protein
MSIDPSSFAIEKKSVSVNQRLTNTPELVQALVDGVSLDHLALIFGKDRRSVQMTMRSVKPSGKRGGYPIYSIAEASRYLMEPLVDIEEYIKKLRPNDLPPLLLKEFWAGQLNKQKFDLQAGRLWPTDKVMAVFADVFKKLKQGISLFSDTIEAKSELTEKQRKILNKLADGLLVELHRTLVEGDIDDGSVKDDGLGD